MTRPLRSILRELHLSSYVCNCARTQKKKKNAVKIYNSNIEFQLGRQCIAKAKYKAAKRNRWKYGLKYKSKEKEPFTPHE